MVEAKLRVEVTEFSNVNNPFYGNTIRKKVVEETLIHDMDKRKFIAPCGVIATFSIDKSYEDADGNKVDAKDVFDIKVNRYYLDEDTMPNLYHAIFNVDEKTYYLSVVFGGKHIVSITLSEWLSCGDFEDDEDPDNIYGATNNIPNIQKGLVNCGILES